MDYKYALIKYLYRTYKNLIKILYTNELAHLYLAYKRFVWKTSISGL